MPNISQNMRILIIDDNPSLANIFQKFLQMKGFFVTAETTLKTGLKHLENNSYHAIFIDAPLGDYDDKKILTLLQKNYVFKKTAVFLFSGINFDNIELDEWKKNGLHSYLKKPVKRSVIIKELDSLRTTVFTNQTISKSEDEEATTEQLARLEQLEKQIHELESQPKSIVKIEGMLIH